MFKSNISRLNNTYGEFIASQNWNIYGTTTYKSPISSTSNRRLFERLFQSEKSIDKMFFVSEPYISSNHVHCHFLISCNDDIVTLNKLTSRFSRYGRHQINLISDIDHYKNDKNEFSVCYYVTKSLSKGVDYDFLIKNL